MTWARIIQTKTQTQAEAQAQTQTEPEITLTLTPDEIQDENQKQLSELEAKKAEEDDKLKAIDPIESTEFTEAEKKTIDFILREDWYYGFQYSSSVWFCSTEESNWLFKLCFKECTYKRLRWNWKYPYRSCCKFKNTSDSDEKKGFFASLFDKGKSKIEEFRARYDRQRLTLKRLQVS